MGAAEIESALMARMKARSVGFILEVGVWAIIEVVLGYGWKLVA